MRARWRAPAVWLACLVMLVGVSFAAVRALYTPTELTVAILDVGQGDAILVRTPDAQTILIDGGPDGTAAERLGSYTSFFDRTIDLVLLSHAHADHYMGLGTVIERYQVKRVLLPPIPSEAYPYQAFTALLVDRNIPHEPVTHTTRMHLGSGLVLDMYASPRARHPDDLNDSSLVVKLYASSTVARQDLFLFMGDAGVAREEELGVRGALSRVDVLKVGHQGSRTSSGARFVAATMPLASVISVGAKNNYGHPHQEVVERLTAQGSRVFRTDVDGDIVFTRSPTGVAVHTSRSKQRAHLVRSR